MEQKKILWIIGAVGIFLLVIIGAALIIYSPPTKQDPLLAEFNSEDSVWINPELSKKTPPLQKEETQEVTEETSLAPKEITTNDLTVISTNTNVYAKDGLTTIDLSPQSQNAQDPLPPQTVDNTIEQKVIEAPQNTEPAQNVKTVVPITTPKPVATTPAKKTSTPPAVKKQSTQAPTVKKQSTPAPVVKEPAPVKAKPLPDQFWIQVASFTKKDNAESARKSLEKEKIPVQIFTFNDKKGKLFYRLRVGPYTTKSEAEFWLPLIKRVDEFKDTKIYITNSSKPAK